MRAVGEMDDSNGEAHTGILIPRERVSAMVRAAARSGT